MPLPFAAQSHKTAFDTANTKLLCDGTTAWQQQPAQRFTGDACHCLKALSMALNMVLSM